MPDLIFSLFMCLFHPGIRYPLISDAISDFCAYLRDLNSPPVVIPLHIDDWISRLQCPGVHDLLHSHVGGKGSICVGSVSQVMPKIVLLRVAIFPEMNMRRIT